MDKLTLLSDKAAVDLYYFGPAHVNGEPSWCSQPTCDACGVCLCGEASAAARSGQQRRHFTAIYNELRK
jgi:hypothetical protein